jgi:1-phosphatidylinositol-3-phosphate 5-kinase
MSNVDNKPLPSLPPPSRFAAPAPLLAVDSRTHLRAFLRHTLIEEGVIHASEEYPEEQSPSTVDAPPSWISELEGALDELGQRITSGGWLAGFRRARCALRTSLDAEEAKTRETATAKEEKKAQKEKERDEEKRKGADATAKDSSAVREASEHSTRTATSVVIKDTDAEAAAAAARKELSLHQLGELVSHPSPPTPKPSLRHLLLMVSQYSGSLVRSREDATWDQIPSRVGCSFAEGAFNVSPLGQISGTVLFGVEEWTGTLITDFLGVSDSFGREAHISSRR